MKATSFLSLGFLAALYCSGTQAQDSPFAWTSSSQQVISPFAKAGKMEQRGRTGVAAMHAVLLK